MFCHGRGQMVLLSHDFLLLNVFGGNHLRHDNDLGFFSLSLDQKPCKSSPSQEGHSTRAPVRSRVSGGSSRSTVSKSLPNLQTFI